jgi:hypothetical protein
MGHRTKVLRYGEVDEALGRAWDALPAGRGLQADYFDSWAWLASWGHGVGRESVDRVRIVLAGDDHAPQGLLPLVARTRHHWESAGVRAVGTARPRWRPVLGTEEPDPEVLAALVEQAASAGVRELVLHRLPTRDPATTALLAALDQAGFHVHRHERSSDNVAVVEGGWEECRSRFAGFERSVRRSLKRFHQSWEPHLEEYGPHTGPSPVDGFAIYADVQRRSWKGGLPEATHASRLELVRRTERLGWCRVYVLRIAGFPAAAELWFRLGDAAFATSTAYDERMAAVGPGSIIAWWAQERIFAEPTPPRLIDLLPGHNAQKDRLAPDRTPLLIVEAARHTLVSGASLPLRRHARVARRAAAGRLIALARQARARARSSETGTVVREVTLPPAQGSLAVVEVELDGPRRRFLAVAGGHRSPEAMASTWSTQDRWWQVGPQPLALIRVTPSHPGTLRAREVVLVAAAPHQLQDLLQALAAGLEATLQAALPASNGQGQPGQPIPIHQAPLPWPAVVAG